MENSGQENQMINQGKRMELKLIGILIINSTTIICTCTKFNDAILDIQSVTEHKLNSMKMIVDGYRRKDMSQTNKCMKNAWKIIPIKKLFN